jgi:hypothetical protein
VSYQRKAGDYFFPKFLFTFILDRNKDRDVQELLQLLLLVSTPNLGEI